MGTSEERRGGESEKVGRWGEKEREREKEGGEREGGREVSVWRRKGVVW